MHEYENMKGALNLLGSPSVLKPASGAAVKETRSDKYKVSVSVLWLFVLV